MSSAPRREQPTSSLRYSTYQLLSPVTHSYDVLVNGRLLQTVTATPTTAELLVDRHHYRRRWSQGPTRWRSAVGQERVATPTSTRSRSAPTGSPAPSAQQTDPLGGWIRGFDTATYNTTPACTPGQTAATCVAGLEPLHTDGLLDRAGWRLLDDTQSAVWTKNGWVQARPARGDVEDGYLFVYGHDYAGALHTLRALTGPAPLLPRNIFGVWYSDYTPTRAPTSRTRSIPHSWPNERPAQHPVARHRLEGAQRLERLGVEHDTLPRPHVLPAVGARPRHRRHLEHPLEHRRQRPEAGHSPSASPATRWPRSTCTTGPCKVWDWSSIPQAESNFALQQSFQQQGVSLLVAGLVLRRLDRLHTRA